jgi:hypothetical protein
MWLKLLDSRRLKNVGVVLCSIAFLPTIAGGVAHAGGVGGRGIQAQIASCPDTRTSILIAPILGGIAAATASNLAGAAVDAIANYLTKDRAVTSQVSLALEGEEVKQLFGDRNNKCLYVFLITPQLKRHLESNKDWQTKNRVTSDFVNQIVSRNLTRFFAVISFSKPDNIADQTVGTTSYFRPNILMWHYSKFIDSGCPLFRSCNKRDVVVSMELARPRNANEDKGPIRSVPLAVGMSGTTANEVGLAMANSSSLAWFSVDTTSPSISNLRFSITETSRPGALASAIGSAVTSSKQDIQQAAQRVVYTNLDEKARLLNDAFDEYKKYVELYESAKEAGQKDMTIPDNRYRYTILKNQVLTQLRIAKAAWVVAGIGSALNELGPLPYLP